jgi:hypothetical protein
MTLGTILTTLLLLEENDLVKVRTKTHTKIFTVEFQPAFLPSL